MDPLDAFMAGLAEGDGMNKRARRACAHCGAASPPCRCSRCQQRWYCGARCQKADYRSHRRTCRASCGDLSDDDGSSEARPSAMEAEDEALSSRSGIDVAATALAEQGRYLAALASWDAALAQPDIAAEEASPVALDRALRRSIAATHELRAQAMMELDRAFDAIRAASRAVRCDGASPWAHLTLGRAQLNFGELELAIASLERAASLSGGGGGGGGHSCAAALSGATDALAYARSLRARQLALLRQSGGGSAVVLRARTLPAGGEERERGARGNASGSSHRAAAAKIEAPVSSSRSRRSKKRSSAPAAMMMDIERSAVEEEEEEEDEDGDAAARDSEWARHFAQSLETASAGAGWGTCAR